MSKQNHTPGRIRVVGTGHTHVRLESCDKPVTAAIGQRVIGSAEREVDGNRLALCWNCHDPMLEVLQVIVKQFDSDPDGRIGVAIVNDARAAIQAAKEAR